MLCRRYVYRDCMEQLSLNEGQLSAFQPFQVVSTTRKICISHMNHATAC